MLIAAASLVTSTVKPFAAPSAWTAAAAGAEAALAGPAVPVNTSTLPASAEAGAAHARHATTAASNERRPVRMCLRAWIMAGSWRG